jgi:hypothetical protein
MQSICKTKIKKITKKKMQCKELYMLYDMKMHEQ